MDVGTLWQPLEIIWIDGNWSQCISNSFQLIYIGFNAKRTCSMSLRSLYTQYLKKAILREQKELKKIRYFTDYLFKEKSKHCIEQPQCKIYVKKRVTYYSIPIFSLGCLLHVHHYNIYAISITFFLISFKFLLGTGISSVRRGRFGWWWNACFCRIWTCHFKITWFC